MRMFSACNPRLWKPWPPCVPKKEIAYRMKMWIVVDKKLRASDEIAGSEQPSSEIRQKVQLLRANFQFFPIG